MYLRYFLKTRELIAKTHNTGHCFVKLVILSSLYGFEGGGAGIIASQLARGLFASGHQVVVVTLGDRRYPICTEEDGLRIYRFRPLNIYTLEEKDAYPTWQKAIWQTIDLYNVQCADVFKSVLLKEAPDIVHIHKMRGFSGAVWSVGAKLFPGRVIQTCHDYESMSPDGILRGAIGRMALRKQWPIRGYQLIRAQLSAGVSVVTAPSSLTLKRITGSGLFPSARTAVIPNTHGWSRDKLRLIHQKGSDLSKDDVRFLFMGRLEREKGIFELCEAFLQVFKLHPNVQLDIAGWGTLDSDLHEKYGKHPGINFLGALDGQAKEAALHKATVIVIPTLVEEVFGLVTVEAYAFGKPVIASHVGGLPELVRHGETGWLVEAGNVQAWAEQLEAVVGMDPLQLAQMRRSCRECSYRFSLENVLAEYLDLYRQMIK